jgi:class 3 adenylate cyclase/HAMP domain-containing protein
MCDKNIAPAEDAMAALTDNMRFLRGGLFTKYVASMVGLVVVVLAVNGAIEIWISYRATRTALIGAMADRSTSVARTVEQSVADLERQISWVTRASVTTVEQRRADYAQLMNQVRSITMLAQINGEGREQLRLTRQTVALGSNADLTQDSRVRAAVQNGVSYAPAGFRDHRPTMSIAVAHSGRDAGVTLADIDLRFLGDIVGDARAASPVGTYLVDHQGRVLAASSLGLEVGQDVSKLPQVAALLASGTVLSSGTDAAGNAVLSAAAPVPKLDWFVIAEQPRSQALLPVRDQLLRIGLLIALGLGVATLAGMVLARRMLIPIRALHAGARRLGEGDFAHRLDVKTDDEFEELADQFNGMAAQLQSTYAGLESKVEERTRELARSISELKALEEVGRAMASSLDLAAVLPTIGVRARDISSADAVLIYGYDAAAQHFYCLEAFGLGDDGTARAPRIAAHDSVLGEAAAGGVPIAIDDLSLASDGPLRQIAREAGFQSVLIVPLADSSGILGSLVLLRAAAGELPSNLIGLMRTFANQAVVAMRNARLFHEVDRKGRELATAHDTVRQQADQLRAQTEQLRDWNRSLEERVEKQLGEIERIRRLERFLPPQVAQLIASSDGHEALLSSHRREVTVVFCDLRGFTAFTEASEPEEAMNVLREYHAALGELIFRYEGTLDRYAGDGVMILFNAPIQFPDHAARAVKMAVEMRDTIGGLTQTWRSRGHNLGFGVGIAVGYATLGQIGFEHRLEYAAIGSVTNLASRLCDEARAGQIIVSRRAFAQVERCAVGEPVADLMLKGFAHPVAAVHVTGWRDEGQSEAPLREAAAR